MKNIYPSLFLISILILSCKNQSRQDSNSRELNCIEAIIQKDNGLGQTRNLACKRQSLSKTIQEYISALEKLDFQDCPDDFTTAFQLHLKAWEAILPLTDEHPEMRGEMHQLFNILGDRENGEVFKAKVNDIWTTWSEVEKAME